MLETAWEFTQLVFLVVFCIQALVCCLAIFAHDFLWKFSKQQIQASGPLQVLRALLDVLNPMIPAIVFAVWAMFPYRCLLDDFVDNIKYSWISFVIPFLAFGWFWGLVALVALFAIEAVIFCVHALLTPESKPEVAAE
jgi:hypothetical protein